MAVAVGRSSIEDFGKFYINGVEHVIESVYFIPGITSHFQEVNLINTETLEKLQLIYKENE